jgi:hypothetical protein
MDHDRGWEVGFEDSAEMIHQTEAACLLRSGALYGSRILLQRPGGDGEPIFAGFKQAAFSLYFGDAPIYHFDGEGRWQRAYVDGIHYLKGLDATVQAIDRVREGGNLVLKRRTLGYAEASDFDARVRAAAINLLGALHDGLLERVEPPPSAQPLAPDELLSFLERIAAWDASAWFAHRETYVATYGPLSFLPPDIPNAVVLQATLGHAGGIAFGLGRVAAHEVRSARAFEEHAEAVKALLGRRVEQARGLFLAGGDVLRQPADQVETYLEIAARVFRVSSAPDARLGGIDAFLDDLSAGLPDRTAWSRFRERHLRRVSLGVESGDEVVRSLYGKTWRNESLHALVADLKEAGLGVNLLVLVDAGGVEAADRHVEATSALVNSLPLGTGDLVALLDGNEVRDPDRSLPGFTPLKGARWADQQSRLRQGLATVRSERGAKVAPYSLEKQSG